MSDPRFVSFIVYVDNSRVLSTSSPESGVEVMHSKSKLWSMEATCRCVYISVVYSYHMTDLYIQYEMYIEILFSTHYVLTLYHLLPQLISRIVYYVIYSVHVHPDYYILSLRCEIVPLVLCDSISIV